MKRKLMIFMMCSAMVLGMAACGKSESAPPDQPAEVETAATPDETGVASKPVTDAEGSGADTNAEDAMPLTAPLAYGEIELPQLQEAKVGEEVAVVTTNMGEFTLRFFPEDAPKAVENFLTHAKDGYYDGVIFHRVVNEFVIQGGDPQGTGMGGESIWGGVFENETSPKLHHLRGALAMANSGKDTNGSQFYIVHNNQLSANIAAEITDMKDNLDQVVAQDDDGVYVTMGDYFPEAILDSYLKDGGTPMLDGGYTVFGHVVSGMDVVDAIAAVEFTPGDGPDGVNGGKPVKDVVIEKIEVKPYKK